jgi:hypothetical protein
VPSAVVRRDRPRRSTPDRLGSNPDRIAAWAVVVGLLMAVIAATSAHGAVLNRPVAPLVGLRLAAAPAAPQLSSAPSLPLSSAVPLTAASTRLP